MSSRRALVAGLALALDRLLGDPPNPFHPVAWMGRVIGFAERFAPRCGRLGPLSWGLLIAACCAGTSQPRDGRSGRGAGGRRHD